MKEKEKRNYAPETEDSEDETIFEKGVGLSRVYDYMPYTYHRIVRVFETSLGWKLENIYQDYKANRRFGYQELYRVVDIYIQRDIITLEDAMSLSEDKLMNKILKQVHPFSIFYSESDNRWHTTIADATQISGRKSVARKKKCDLERFLFEHYHLQQNTETQKTFAEIFKLVQERKLQFIKNPEKLLSAKNTQLKIDSDYRRYFSDTDFEQTPIDELTKKDIENICLFNLQRYDLKKKAFASLRGILKSVFNMAYSEYWITDNIYQRVDFQIFKNMIAPETAIDERVHSKQDVSAILKEIHKKEADNPKLCSAWALELQMLMGLRRGEVPPLEWSDITDEYIIIRKEQLTCGNDFVIVYHTKTYKDRYFSLTNDLKCYFRRLKEMQDNYYPNSKYLFPADTDNGVITNRAVYFVYHMASALFGNSPEVAKQNYFTGIDMSVATDVLNKRCLLS